MNSLKLLFSSFLFLILSICLNAQNIQLTPMEKEWIKNNPVITVQNEKDWEPFNYNQNNIPTGHSIDYMKLLVSKVGLEVRFIQGKTWKEYLEMLKAGKLDVIANIAKTPQREKFYSYTSEYQNVLSSLYVHEQNHEKYTSLKDFEGKTISVVKGMVGESVLRNNYPKINIYPVKTSLDALKAVIYGKAEGVVQVNALGNRLIRKYNLQDIKPIFEVSDPKFNMHLHLATNRQNSILRDILQKGIFQITDKELKVLQEKYFNNSKKLGLNLTKQEKEWLKNNTSLKVGVPRFQAPLLITDKGKIEGVIPEYLDLLTKKLGVDLKIHLIDSQKDIVKKASKGKLDAKVSVNYLDTDRKSSAFRSEHFLDFPLVIASKEKTPIYNGLNDTNLKNLAISRDSPLIEKISNSYPKIQLIFVSECKDGLNMLFENKADGYICNPSVIAHKLRSLDMRGIVVSSITPYRLGFTLQGTNEDKIFYSMVNKAIQVIESYELNEIRERWQQVELQKIPDYSGYFQIGVILLIFILGIVVWISWWNKRLRHEIIQKEIAQKDALEKERRLSTLLDNIPGMAFRAKNEPDWPMIEVNQAAQGLTGYTREEFVSQAVLYNNLILEKDRERLWKEIQEAINKKIDYYIEYQIETKSGQIKWVWERGKPLFSEMGELLCLEGLIVDNSLIKEIELNLQEEQNKALEQKVILESIFDNAATFMVILNKNGDIVFFNLFAEEISGYKKEEILGKNWIETFIPDYEQDNIKEVFKDIMKNIDRHNDYINPIRAKDGALHYIRWRNSIYQKGEQEYLLGVGHDITESLKLETLYRDLHTSMQDAYGMIDLDGKLTDVNDMACELLGYTKEEFFNMTLEDITPKKWLAVDQKYHAELLKTKGCTEVFEKEFICKDGSLLPAEVRICAIKNSAGEIEGFWGIVRDISERKKASEELVKTNKLLIEAQETAHIAHWTFDPKTGIPWWSQELYRIYDRNPSEGPLPYSEHPKLVHPDDWSWFNTIVQDTAQTGKPFNIILRIVRPDKSIRFINSICKPDVDDNGNVVEMRGTIQDITELKQAEQLSKESERKLRTLIDTIPDMVWMKDTQGVYKFANSKYQEFLDLSESDIIGKTDYELYENTQADFYREHDILAIKAGKPRSNEEDAIYANGHVTLLETVKAPVYDSLGELIGVLGIGRDISELRKKEEMLISQSRSAAMGDMISMIAHQWKQPLSALSMVANNMKVDYELDTLKAENIENYYSDIDRQVKHLSNTIDDFRDFFKPNKTKQLVLVQNVIDETLKIIDKSLENNNIQLIKDFRDVGEISIFSNELFHILLNVINNAKEALIHREIEDRKIFISTYTSDKNICIEVEDNAGGIEEEIKERIFEPYFTTKEELNGTGIGLYMAKTIIEKHFMGKIEVENTKLGAKFRLVIPK